jgi:hypothetical protein
VDEARKIAENAQALLPETITTMCLPNSIALQYATANALVAIALALTKERP